MSKSVSGCILTAIMLTAHLGFSASSTTYEITVAEFSGASAVVVESKVPTADLGATIGTSIKKVLSYLQVQGVSPVSAAIAQFFSYSNTESHFQTGFFVAQPVPSCGEFKTVLFPATTVATTIHVGSSEESGAAYEALHGWMNTNGYAPAGAPWEEYLSDRSTASSTKPVTRISYPVRRLP